jgi:Protein of unknown function (DUF1236)
MTHFRNGGVVLALLASVSLASAQNTPMGPSSGPPAARSDSAKPSAGLQLSAQQKTAIFQSVTKDKVKTPPPANLSLSVGAQVPASVELYALPANIVSEVPAAKQFKYTVAQNQVVIVDPTNMKIVDIIKQ